MFESDLNEIVPGSLEECINFLNNFYWNITWRQDREQWIALSGDRLLVATHTEQELKAFIMGMTIALSVLPDSIINDIRKYFEE
jgi:hypothetical protein